MSSRNVKDIPLLVVSCDRYADLWPVFFDVLRARWPDCPFPLYLGSNQARFERPGVTTLCAGVDRSWAGNLSRMLDLLSSEYVLFFLEDFFLRSAVNTESVVSAVNYFRSRNVDCGRLAPLPAPTPLPPVPFPDCPTMGPVPPEFPYRVSAQIALWRVPALREYLVPGFSAWDFEHIGTRMSRHKSQVFAGPFAALIDYDHGVEKGRWKLEGIEICRAAGVTPDTRARGVFSVGQLDAHYQAGQGAGELGHIKARAITAFLHGRRREGWGHCKRHLRSAGPSLRLLSIAAFGMLGPWALEWLDRQHVHWRTLSARLRDATWSLRQRRRATSGHK